MLCCYAVLIGGVLVREARATVAKAVGGLCPLVVMIVIVATGNHFLVDAAAGAAVSAVAVGITSLLLPPIATARWGRRGSAVASPRRPERAAARERHRRRRALRPEVT
jgi:hypothetical protein